MRKGRLILVALTVILTAASTASAQRRGRGRGPAAPACTTLQCDILADWQRTANTIITIADKMPADKWGAKPTPAQQTFGERVLHIAQTDGFALGMLGGQVKAPAIPQGAAASKDATMAALRASFEWGESVIKEFPNDAQWVERVNGAFLGSSVPRLKILYFDIGHSQDIYGQLAVYLRLNGLVPPASDRP